MAVGKAAVGNPWWCYSCQKGVVEKTCCFIPNEIKVEDDGFVSDGIEVEDVAFVPDSIEVLQFYCCSLSLVIAEGLAEIGGEREGLWQSDAFPATSSRRLARSDALRWTNGRKRGTATLGEGKLASGLCFGGYIIERISQDIHTWARFGASWGFRCGGERDGMPPRSPTGGPRLGSETAVFRRFKGWRELGGANGDREGGKSNMRARAGARTTYKERRWDAKQLIGSGGMPSSHSASVSALAVAIGYQEGFGSPVFAMMQTCKDISNNNFSPIFGRPFLNEYQTNLELLASHAELQNPMVGADDSLVLVQKGLTKDDVVTTESVHHNVSALPCYSAYGDGKGDASLDFLPPSSQTVQRSVIGLKFLSGAHSLEGKLEENNHKTHSVDGDLGH
ncbi:hypothetical protein KSP39_PZI023814 [Platanthera zijinensis]|uniref:Uncharacterized protein n=1 Tax=Platanthera zijinensis TaxID=2320716 RepID=A0AAP0AT68_9ASPA